MFLLLVVVVVAATNKWTLSCKTNHSCCTRDSTHALALTRTQMLKKKVETKSGGMTRTTFPFLLYFLYMRWVGVTGVIDLQLFSLSSPSFLNLPCRSLGRSVRWSLGPKYFGIASGFCNTAPAPCLIVPYQGTVYPTLFSLFFLYFVFLLFFFMPLFFLFFLFAPSPSPSPFPILFSCGHATL